MPAAVVVTAFAASGAAAAVGAAVAGAVGLGAVSALTATAIGVGIASGTMTAVQGGSASDVLKSAVLGGALSYAGGAIGEAVFGTESVAASDAVNKAIESGVSDSMINMAMTTSDPLAALNAAAGWTSSDPSYLMNIGYSGLITDPISGSQVPVETAARAQSSGWMDAANSGIPGAEYVDVHGNAFNAAGEQVAFGDYSTNAPTSAPTGGTTFNPSGDTIISSVPTTQGGVNGVQVTNAAGDSWFEPAAGGAPVIPDAPLTTTSTGQAIVAGTEIGQQIPGAYSVDANGTYYNYNGEVVATTQANGAVVAPNGLQYIEPSAVAAPGAPELAGGPAAPAPVAPMPENTIPVRLADGSVGAYDPATGTVYDAAGGVDGGATQTMQTAQSGGTSGPGKLLAEAAKDTTENVVSDVPFRVEVTGAAGTAETPNYVTGPLTEGSQLATQAQIDSGAATWNPNANAWEVTPPPTTPVPVIPPSEPYSPLTVGGRVLTPAEYAGAADTLTVGGSSVGAGVGGGLAAPAVPEAPVALAPVPPPEVITPPASPAPATSASGAPAVSTTPTITGGTVTTYADGTTITTPPAGTTNPVASVDVTNTGAGVGGAIIPGTSAPATVITPTGDVVPTTTTPPVATLPPVVDAVPTPVPPKPVITPPPVPDVPGLPPVVDAVPTPVPEGTPGLPGSVSSGGLSAKDLALLAAGWTIVNGILTPPMGGVPYDSNGNRVYPTGTVPTLAQGGLNPGWIQATPFYKTTSPVQAQYYWGSHPYQPGPTFSPESYNTVPGAPATPWGLQQAQAPFDVNTFIRQTMTPQQQAALAGSAPQYYAPIAPVSPAVGG